MKDTSTLTNMTPCGFFQDRHSVAKSEPLTDKSQDWILLHGEENSFGTVLKFSRKIDTCDKDDVKIQVI